MNGLRPQNEDVRVPHFGGPLRGVVVSTIAQGSSGSVTLYSDPEPVDAADVTSTGTVTAWAVYAEHFTGTKVIVWKIGQQYHILGGEC